MRLCPSTTAIVFLLMVLASIAKCIHVSGPAKVSAHTTASALHTMPHHASSSSGRYHNTSCWATYDKLEHGHVFNPAYCTCNNGHSGSIANASQVGPYTACPVTAHSMHTSHVRTRSSLKGPSPMSTPPCVMSQNPDAGQDGLCVCTNGATISPVKVHGGLDCPWDTLPSNAVGHSLSHRSSTKVTGPVTITASASNAWIFTQTLGGPGGTIVACQSISYLGVPGTTVPQCAGSTAVLYTPPPQPSLILTIGNDTSAYIGTLSGTDLLSSITSALNGVCSMGDTNCGKAATISPISYPSGDQISGLAEGYLEIDLDYVRYENDTMRDTLIAAIAAGVNQTLYRENACKNFTRVIGGGSNHSPVQNQEYLACFVTGLVYVNYYSGNNVYGADDLMYVRLSFGALGDQANVGMELCADCMVGIDMAAIILFWCPPCQPVIGAVSKAVSGVCNAVSDIHSAASLATASTGVSLR